MTSPQDIAQSILKAIWPTCSTEDERTRWLATVRELVRGPVQEILVREIARVAVVVKR